MCTVKGKRVESSSQEVTTIEATKTINKLSIKHLSTSFIKVIYTKPIHQATRIIMSRSHRNSLHADRIIQKEKEYQNEITEITVSHKMLAEHMAIDGVIQESVQRALQDSPTDAREFETFLQVHREKSKTLAENHVALKRKASAFINAMKLVKTDIQTAASKRITK